MLGQLIIGGWKSFWESVPLQTIDLSQDWHPCAVSVFTKPTYIDLSLYILLCCSGCQGTIHRFSLHNLHHWFINSRCSAHLILSPTIQKRSRRQVLLLLLSNWRSLEPSHEKRFNSIQCRPPEMQTHCSNVYSCMVMNLTCCSLLFQNSFLYLLYGGLPLLLSCLPRPEGCWRIKKTLSSHLSQIPKHTYHSLVLNLSKLMSIS